MRRESNQIEDQPGSFCFVCASNIEASVPFLNEVVSAGSLDAHLRRLSQFKVESLSRFLAVAGNPTFNHLPVLPILTCKQA